METSRPSEALSVESDVESRIESGDDASQKRCESDRDALAMHCGET